MDIQNLLSGLLGGVIGGLCAVAAVLVQDGLNRKSARNNEAAVVRGFLLAIRTEIETLWTRWDDTVGQTIAALPPGHAFVAYYGVYQDYFSVYTGNTFLLGRVKDDELRRLIVKAYTCARGIVDAMRMNNEMNLKFENATLLFQQTQAAIHQQHTNAFLQVLVQYAGMLKSRHTELKDHVERVLRAINGAVV